MKTRKNSVQGGYLMDRNHAYEKHFEEWNAVEHHVDGHAAFRVYGS